MPSGKSKKTHSKGRKTKLHKRGVRKIFSARHIDQVRCGSPWPVRRSALGGHLGLVVTPLASVFVSCSL